MLTNTLTFKSIKKGEIRILLIKQTNLFIAICDYYIDKKDFVDNVARSPAKNTTARKLKNRWFMDFFRPPGTGSHLVSIRLCAKKLSHSPRR